MDDIMTSSFKDYGCYDYEENEFIEMGKILPTLLEEGLINDVEYRIIATTRKLLDRRSAVYSVMASKNQQEAADLFERFRKLHYEIYSQQNAQILTPVKRVRTRSISAKECSNPIQTTGRNPLLMNIVISIIFGFLPLKEIKICRFVNHQWNSTAELFLRKHSTIYFKPEIFPPSVFLEVFKQSRPLLPFTSFKFSNSGKRNNKNAWTVSELDHFFQQWGHKILRLELDKLILKKRYFDVTPWIAMMPNLFHLQIDCFDIRNHNNSQDIIFLDYKQYVTSLHIRWETLKSVKSISLTGCDIFINGENLQVQPIISIKPLKITLDRVCFKYEKLTTPRSIISMNHLIDFSKTSQIHLKSISNVVFDMTNQVFDAQTLRFETMNFTYFGRSRGKVYSVAMQGCRLVEPAHSLQQFQLKELFLHRMTIDLSQLPHSVEKIHFYYPITILSSQSVLVRLPNLKYVCFRPHIQGDFLSQYYSCFSNCENGVDLEIDSSFHRSYLDVSLNVDAVHKCIKRIKITQARSVVATGGNKNEPLNLDTLILEDFNLKTLLTCATKLLSKIRPHVLVLVLTQRSKQFKQGKINTGDIVQFVERNVEVDKIIIGAINDVDLYQDFPFEESGLSRFVDEYASFYQFENQYGKCISAQVFDTWRKMDGFKNTFSIN